jgi:cobalt-zinc-cadmium efflux system protein
MSPQERTKKMKLHNSQESEKRFILSMTLTSIILVVEIVGGIFSNSLALLSDAGHVLMDVFALAISYFALKISARPSDDLHTFGYHRVEVFAALINGLSLVAIAVAIVVEAIQRFQSPLQIHSTEMLIIAVVGLVVNLIVAFVLQQPDGQYERPGKKDLNVHSAFLHVLGDAISSVGVIVAAILISLTHAVWLDPLVSILIAGILLFSAYRILRSSLHILIEGVPEGLSITEIRQELIGLPTVEAVHDLHVWNICSGHISLSAHVVLEDQAPEQSGSVLKQINEMLDTKYAINHTTIQLESHSAYCYSDGGCN